MNPALKQAHLQTAQCQLADQSLQKSLLFHTEKKNKKISPALQKLNLPTDKIEWTKKLKLLINIGLSRSKKEPLLTTMAKKT